MAMIGKVKRMYFREKKSVREIVRLTSLSRNTVRKWLKTPVLEEPRYRRSEAPGKLTAFHEALKLALKADAHRPAARAAHGARAARADQVRRLRRQLQPRHRLRARVAPGRRPVHVRQGLRAAGLRARRGIPVRLERRGLGGRRHLLPHAGLAPQAVRQSRAFWLVAYPSQGHEMLFDAHTRSLRGHGRHRPARHLRQHEDGRGQGQEGQGPQRQQALRRDVRALPVRRRLLQRRLGLGEGRRREERAGQPAADLDRGGQAEVRQASPNSTPGWAIAAGRCGTRCATPSTTSSAWPRCSSTSGRT